MPETPLFCGTDETQDAGAALGAGSSRLFGLLTLTVGCRFEAFPFTFPPVSMNNLPLLWAGVVSPVEGKLRIEASPGSTSSTNKQIHLSLLCLNHALLWTQSHPLNSLKNIFLQKVLPFPSVGFFFLTAGLHTAAFKNSLRAGKMAQQVEALLPSLVACFDPWNLHSRRRKLAPGSCPLTWPSAPSK